MSAALSLVRAAAEPPPPRIVQGCLDALRVLPQGVLDKETQP